MPDHSRARGGILLLGCLLAGSPMASAEEIVVAAASDLGLAIREILSEFEGRTGHSAKLTLGASGSFYGQIVNGAPYDVFLSADLVYPRRLVEDGLGEADSLLTYGIGHLVLWVPNASSLSPEGSGMRLLLDPSVRRIAVANPAHAPYGRAAVAALRNAGLWEQVRSRIVYGESVIQAAQFVQSRAADVGIIALSLALSSRMEHQGRYWEVPADLYPRLEQGAILLSGARRRGTMEAARQLLDILRGPAAASILERHGFTRPGGGEQ